MKPGMIENDMQNAMTITIHTDAETAMPRELPPHSFLVAVFNS